MSRNCFDLSRAITLLLTLSVGVLTCVASCGDDHGDSYASDLCRFEPQDCNGGAGAFCSNDGDCLDGLFCCDDNNNCGDGMCTADCRSDADCPFDMRCEHDMCFYACDVDEDCANGMSCEHGMTVCEWQ